jgi:cytochrome c-type biogenesis protein
VVQAAHVSVTDQENGPPVLGVLMASGRLMREFRFAKQAPTGLASAPVLGFVFGIGWTPCIGPTLTAVNVLAFNEATATRGAVLTAAYCLGLGLPFIVAALAFRRTLGAFGWVKRHYRWVMRIGGVMMVATGVLLMTGIWDRIVYELTIWSSQFTVGF